MNGPLPVLRPAPVPACAKPAYTKREAQTARNNRLRHGVKFLRIYECPICGYWHITKKQSYDDNSA